MSRTFTLPTARTFLLAGTAEINSADSDYLIDQIIGLNTPAAGGAGATVISANSSTRLDYDRQARANQAVDADPSTAWIAETGPQDGEWLSVDLSKPITFDHLDLQVLNDGRHSLPSRLTISSGGESRTVDVPVPAVGRGRRQNSTTTIPVSFPVITGSSIKVTIDTVQPVKALDYYSTFAGITDILPVGIAELGLPGVTQPAPPAQLPAVCTGALLSVDGRPVDVEVTGRTADALGGAQVSIAPCGDSAGGLALKAGTHTVTTGARLPSGWSVDQVWLGSGAGGAPAAAATVTAAPAAPPVQVVHQDRTSMTLKVPGTGRAFWLVLGESHSSGWAATVGGRSLGPPRLIDAFANGWYMPARPAGTAMEVHLEWRPQTAVWAALAASATSILVCVGLAVWPEGGWAGGGWAEGGWAGSGRRRRRSRRSERGRATDARNGAGARWARLPEPAAWQSFARPSGALPRPALLRGIAAAVVWGAVAALVSRPAIGAVAAFAVVAGVRFSWGRAACRVLAIGALIALPVYAVYEQVTHHYWPDIGWPANLSSANDIAWFGLAILGSDAVAGALYSRRRMEDAK